MGGNVRRTIKRLTVREVFNAEPPADRRALMLPDGGNLYLQVSRDSDRIYRSWTFKYELAGKRREMGLGPTHTISLAEARDKARTLRQKLLDGIDPLDEKRNQRQALIEARAKAITFRQVAEAYLDLHLDSFRNAKHRQQWRGTLAAYVFPKIGHMPVADISPADILRVIEPHWTTKQVTISRVRQRIEKILDYATARQYRSGDNPAAHVTGSLPKNRNGRGHYAALPYLELPAFMIELRKRASVSARALEFAILTVARTGEILGATWDEIDLKERVWTISASRMKAGKEHRVPLSSRAIAILQAFPHRDGRVFPLPSWTMLRDLKTLYPNITTHGFRSAFTDWAHEQTAFPKAVIDMALAHTVGDKVEAAYRRGDLFAKRKLLMDAWGKWCARPVPTGATVTPITAVT
jgi:integrase